jgi:hypothetical protein
MGTVGEHWTQWQRKLSNASSEGDSRILELQYVCFRCWPTAWNAEESGLQHFSEGVIR